MHNCKNEIIYIMSVLPPGIYEREKIAGLREDSSHQSGSGDDASNRIFLNGFVGNEEGRTE